MKLSEVKEVLKQLQTIAFQLPDQSLVPNHFHITEVGEITKRFIDCGGTVRKETVVNFQLWNANDYDHRLHPEKLLKIIELSEKNLAIDNDSWAYHFVVRFVSGACRSYRYINHRSCRWYFCNER